MEEEQKGEAEVEEESSREGRAPDILGDPCLPTKAEVEEHNATLIPSRGLCPACVSGHARHRAHRKEGGWGQKRTPELVFSYAFLGSEGETDMIAVLVLRDPHTLVIFALVVPRQGLAHEHDSKDLLKDV